MEIRFIPHNVDKVMAFLKSLPRGVKNVAEKAFSEYLIGSKPHGLKHYSRYKYVSRKKAYGQTFVSDKQRRYVMAMISEGRIDPGVPHRTGRGQRGWRSEKTTRGYTIANDETSMYYSMSDKGQARLNKLAGWRLVSAVVKANLAGAFRAASAAVKQFLKS